MYLGVLEGQLDGKAIVHTWRTLRGISTVLGDAVTSDLYDISKGEVAMNKTSRYPSAD
jgi:hypothetical protein